jgi:hypothetical protein
MFEDQVVIKIKKTREALGCQGSSKTEGASLISII